MLLELKFLNERTLDENLWITRKKMLRNTISTAEEQVRKHEEWNVSMKYWQSIVGNRVLVFSLVKKKLDLQHEGPHVDIRKILKILHEIMTKDE